MSNSWFWNYQGKAQGPVTTLEMETLIREGKLLKHYLVFQEGGLKWQEASQWRELKTYFEARESLKAIKSESQPSQASKQDSLWVVLQREDRSDGVFFRQKGPFTVSEIQKMLQHNLVRIEDHAWTQGMSRWMKLSELDHFAHGNYKIGPVKPSESNFANFEPVAESLPPPLMLAAEPKEPAPKPLPQPILSQPKVIPAMVSPTILTAPIVAAPTVAKSAPVPSSSTSVSPPPKMQPPEDEILQETVVMDLASTPTPFPTPTPTPTKSKVIPTPAPVQPVAPIPRPNPALQKAAQPIQHEEPLEDTAIAELPLASGAEFYNQNINSLPKMKGRSKIVPFITALTAIGALVWFGQPLLLKFLNQSSKSPKSAEQEQISQELPAPTGVNLPSEATPPPAPAQVNPVAVIQQTQPPVQPGLEENPAPPTAPVEQESSLGQPVAITIPVKNQSFQLTLDSQLKILSIQGAFSKGSIYKVMFYAPPGQVIGLPSLFLSFQESVAIDGRLSIAMEQKSIPEGNYRLVISGTKVAFDEKINLTADASTFKAKLQRHRKQTAYSQQQERKKVIELIRRMNSAISRSQKLVTKKEKSAFEKQVDSLAPKEMQLVQSARYELFFPDAWQALAQAHQSLKKMASADSARVPASVKSQLEKRGKDLKNLEAKVRSTTQYR